jgi:TetR/AcrR family transcriptional regulator, transcriptional repressor of aconitase
MPKVSDAHREARREQIITAALDCFAEKGFQKTSMADIIASSGLSAGAIYLHFESKQQIALAVGRRVLGRRVDELDQEARSGTLADPITTLGMLMAHLADDVVDPRLVLQLWGEATADPQMGGLVTDVFATLRHAFVGYLAGWAAAQGMERPEAWARRALPTMLALAQGFMVQRALLPAFDAEAYFDSARLVAGPGLLIPGP